ncbi:hypothetical protein ACLOJK_016801 [Asimina triloba]
MGNKESVGYPSHSEYAQQPSRKVESTVAPTNQYQNMRHSRYIADNFSSLDELFVFRFVASTHDQYVFSFNPDHHYCHGFEEALARYREIVPYLKLSGPTSFAPVIEAAIDIVERSNWQYHVLVIVADGQVTRSADVPLGSFSPQEQATINSIVTASHFPLSIILVGVGDGPWDAMQQFDDNIPQRAFDNFQFVNFHKIMSANMETSKREAAFALAALMEIPFQHRATQHLQSQGRRIQRALGPLPLAPPLEVIEHVDAVRAIPRMTSFESTSYDAPTEQFLFFDLVHGTEKVIISFKVCPICLVNPRDMAFGCGHLADVRSGQSPLIDAHPGNIIDNSRPPTAVWKEQKLNAVSSVFWFVKYTTIMPHLPGTHNNAPEVILIEDDSITEGLTAVEVCGGRTMTSCGDMGGQIAHPRHARVLVKDLQRIKRGILIVVLFLIGAVLFAVEDSVLRSSGNRTFLSPMALTLLSKS